MKIYQGQRSGYAVDVTVNGKALNPRFDLWNHSPTGFEWGYGGSGPAQLALALLAHHLADDQAALEAYPAFKFAVIAKLPHHCWELSSGQIDEALQTIREHERTKGGAPC